MERGFDILCSLNARRAECLRRKFHEPIVVHIDGLRNIGFPLLRLIEVDRHPSLLR
jgi:hypothetical protein